MKTREHGTKKLSEQIYELLRKDIIECNLEPGDLLEESVITERYKIGRTPFREACHWLEAQGLIEIVPHRGCFVASFSNKDINDLFELRLIVEPQVAELACQRKKDDVMEALESNLSEARRLTKVKKANANPNINWNSMDFHVQVSRLTQNRELEDLIENIHTKLMRIVMFTALRTPENYPFNAVHPEIYEAIRAGRASEARKAMIKDILGAREWISTFGR
jgi:DNA-binding GntR family transcriptional regulator